MHSVQEDFYEGNASHVQQHKSSGNKVKRLPFCVTCQNHLNRSEKEVIGERSFQRRHTPILQMLALNSMWEGYGNNCRKPTSRCVGSRRRAHIKSKKKVERNPRLVIAKIIRPQGAKCSQEDELRWENVPIIYEIKIQSSWALRDWSQESSLNGNLKKRSGWVTLTIRTPTLNSMQKKQKQNKTKKNSVEQIILLLLLNK